jgi:ubiquinone/menaquinone biosynthesis C-methylase UbiE
MKTSSPKRWRVTKRSTLVAMLAAAFTLSVCRGQAPYAAESARLAELLGWRAGSVVAEIGAGEGPMSLEAARRVGPQGHVFTNELDSRKLAHLQELAVQAPAHNLTAVQGSQTSTGLPAECCDSIFMRRVYHHFTEPAQLDASLFRALKPGGLLAVIDFPPRAWLPPVPGVPKNRGGHGVPEKIIIQELTAAGFQVEAIPKDWPGDDYCVVFRKPAPPPPRL